MLFLPVLRRAGRGVVRVLLALTVGLLAFLAVDAALEGSSSAAPLGWRLRRPALVVLGAGAGVPGAHRGRRACCAAAAATGAARAGWRGWR